MDIWMLLCMFFVASAQFEYAMQLTISFGKMKKNGTRAGKEGKTKVEEKCRKIDRYALKIFLGVYILTVGAYIYKMSGKPEAKMRQY